MRISCLGRLFFAHRVHTWTARRLPCRGVVYTWYRRRGLYCTPSMRRLPETEWRVAAFAVIACCSCESSAPAAPRPDGLSRAASDWIGTRDASSPAPELPALPKETWVLHVGDSFTDASFQQNLAPRFKAAGVRYVVDATSATYTTTWAYDSAFREWLGRGPSLVIVTLGANEVDIPFPSQHAHPVERIARAVAAAGASCVWTAPPMWKKDTGILQVIHDHCAPCLFFDSDAVLGELRPDERQRDGIHPNERGGARWADAFWQWLSDHRDASRPGWSLRPFEVR
jgi:hypothetical protein